jgi:hypothetical protein
MTITGTEFIAELPEQPCPTRDLSEGSNELVITVGCDALKIGVPDDCVHVAVSATLQQRIADALYCVMPTAKISDLCWIHADNKLEAWGQAQTASPTMDDTSAFVKMSGVLDGQIAGRPGLCAPSGKDWVLSKVLWYSYNAGRAANYGWQVSSGSSAGVTPGVRVIQMLVTSSTLPHYSSHTDYSQMCRLVKRECVLNGEKADLADILMDEELAYLVSHEGPLPGYRQPDVPEPAGDESSCDDSDGSPEWQHPLLSLGERALKFSLAEKARGVRERPLGSNSGPEIANYFRPATRLRKGVEERLGIAAGNWCCVSACAAMKASLLDGDSPPHGYRAGVVEIVRDAVENGCWVDVGTVRSGAFVVKLGDLAVFDRSVPGRPETSWWRHVARVSKVADGDGAYQTLGGNEGGDQYGLTDRNLKAKRLLGFIAYPRAAEPVAIEALALAEELEKANFALWQQASGLIEVSDAVMRGEHGLEHALEDFDEPEEEEEHG